MLLEVPEKYCWEMNGTIQFTETQGTGENVKTGLETSAGLYKEGCIRSCVQGQGTSSPKGIDGAMQTERQCVLHGRGKGAFLACPFLWPEKGSWLSSK